MASKAAPTGAAPRGIAADYLDWLLNLEIAAGYNLIGQMGHCYGGDAI